MSLHINKMYLIWWLALTALFTACNGKGGDREGRGMYYWSTTFNLDSAKLQFLDDHDVHRLYVRYFDVVIDEKGEIMPNASIRFPRSTHSSPNNQQPLSITIIPTIFIVNDVMRHDVSGLAEKILQRILQMNKTHGIENVSELQIDCDWSVQTRKRFFVFMEELHKLAKDQGLQLSATIRLHQLAQKPPSCDHGVLMFYNTGDFTKYEDEHPILDMTVAGPYLQYLKNYTLSLSTAYPIFGWDILFRPIASGTFHYLGIQHFPGEVPTMPGDTLVRRQPTLQEILQAREAVERLRPDANHEVILFDMSNPNINRFKNNDYEKIFGH